IMENFLKGSSPFQRKVARVTDLIVGYADILPDPFDIEAVLVGLLGVSPRFQGQGYGKALLLDATEFAISLNKTRITLGTWGGNLKGMPLYKRQGYNWLPGTDVFMENYMPGIVSCPFFQEFFSRFEWYASFRRQIVQKPDDMTINGMNVYEYHFVGDEENELRVWIDREGKGIHAFHWKKNGRDHSIKFQLSTHEAYLGYGTVPWKLIVKNDLTKALEIGLEVETTKGVIASVLPESIVIPSSSSQTLQGTVRATTKAQETDRNRYRHIKTKTRLKTTFLINNRSLTMTCGLLSRKPVSLQLFPTYSSLRPNRSNELLVSVQNNTKETLKISLMSTLALANGQRREFPSRKIQLNSKSHELVAFDIDLNDMSTSQVAQLQADLGIQTEETTSKLPVVSIPVAIVGETGVVGYRLDEDTLVLENSILQLLIRGRAPYGIQFIRNKIEQITLGPLFSMWGDDIGLPFQGFLNEFSSKEYDSEIKAEPHHFAQVCLTAGCEKKSGLKFTRFITLSAGSAVFSLHYEFHNPTDQLIKDIAFALHFVGWISPIWDGSLFLPLKDGLRVHKQMEWISSRELPSTPEDFTEPWMAIESQKRWVIGTIWDERYTTKILGWRAGLPKLEVSVPDLPPHATHLTSKAMLYVGPGSWNTVRRLWLEHYCSRTHGRDSYLEKHLPIAIPTLNLNLYSVDQPQNLPWPVFPPEEESKANIFLENISKNPISGTLIATPNFGDASAKIKEWEIDGVKTDVWTGELPLRLPDKGIFEIDV
ncbi:MAG: GNAT family N-acetyltransferase, partial [Candidatus Hodarchaeales archaeon]